MDATAVMHQQIANLDLRIEENLKLSTDPELAFLAQEELKELQQQKLALEQAITSLEQTSQNQTSAAMQFSNCTLEIRPGAGGEEAKIWAADLMRMYTRFAAIKKIKIEELEDGRVKILGKQAYTLFRNESGVHRVQRVPETEAQGRIHTSTASVAVIPEVPPSSVEIKEDDLDWQFYRSGGHGGQNVNKVSTAVRLTHKPSGIIVTSQTERYQARNRELALELLRGRLWELEEEKQTKEIGTARSAIGRAMRAEKIRTYNYPQNRVTDHRIHKSWYALDKMLEGNIQDMIDTLNDEKSWEETDPAHADEE